MMLLKLPEKHMSNFLVCIQKGKKLALTVQDGQYGLIPHPPSKEDEVLTAEMKKISLVSEVNTYINTHQWPGKAAIGRLKGEELAQYNSWLDYLDALELVDTSCAPDIEWPTPPAVQAR